MAALDGLQRPSLEALIPRLVERDELPAASAIGMVRTTTGMIAGPALGGVLIADRGLPLTFGIDVATFLVSLALLRLMRAAPPPVEGMRVSLGNIGEGVRYAGGRQVLLGTYVVDIVAMFFGMPIALFPAFASEFGGAGVLGLLYAAPAVGSLAATLTSGWIGHVHRHGAAICFAATGWGMAVLVVGVSPGLGLVLAGPGGGRRRRHAVGHLPPDGLEPDHPRPAARPAGRHRAGQLLDRAAAGQRRVGRGGIAGGRARIIVSGGALCVAGVAVCALALPAFWRYDARRGDG